MKQVLLGKIRRPPRFVPGLVEKRSRQIPCPRRNALTLPFWSEERVAAYYLHWDWVLVGHYSSFECAVEGAKEQVFSLGAQLFGSLEFLRCWLEERHLFLFLFPLQSLQCLAFPGGKSRVADSHVGEFIWQANNDTVRSRVAE